MVLLRCGAGRRCRKKTSAAVKLKNERVSQFEKSRVFESRDSDGSIRRNMYEYHWILKKKLELIFPLAA